MLSMHDLDRGDTRNHVPFTQSIEDDHLVSVEVIVDPITPSVSSVANFK